MRVASVYAFLAVLASFAIWSLHEDRDPVATVDTASFSLIEAGTSSPSSQGKEGEATRESASEARKSPTEEEVADIVRRF